MKRSDDLALATILSTISGGVYVPIRKTENDPLLGVSLQVTETGAIRITVADAISSDQLYEAWIDVLPSGALGPINCVQDDRPAGSPDPEKEAASVLGIND